MPHTRILTELLGLFLPIECAGCGERGRALCASCLMRLRPRALVRTTGGLTVHSGLMFDGVAASAIRAFKEEGRTGLARPLGAALAGPLAAAARDRPVIAVPVPSTHAAIVRRGYAPVELLLEAVGVRPTRVLRPARAVLDQRPLSRSERAENVEGALRCARRLEGAPAIVIVDDVVTTGATLREAHRALSSAGGRVLAAATLASTPLDRASRQDA